MNPYGYDLLGTPGTGFDQYNINITDWSAIAAHAPYTFNQISYSEDAGGKFKSIYIPSSTVAAAIRLALWKVSYIDFQIVFRYSGEQLVDLIHGFYTTYMQRIPELNGVLYWITDIILRGRSINDVRNDFINISNNYKTRYGTTFAYKWNTTDVVISNYTISSPVFPYSQDGWAFLRPSTMLHQQTFYLESISDSGETDIYATPTSYVTQTYYDTSLNIKTRFFETFQCRTEVLLKGMSARVGRTIPASDTESVLRRIYNVYWNTPIRGGSSLAGGLGRPPDIGGFTYWLKKYYVDGWTVDQTIAAMFNNPEPNSINTGLQTLREQGIVSQATDLAVTTLVFDTTLYGARQAVTTTPVVIVSTTKTSTGVTTAATTQTVSVSKYWLPDGETNIEALTSGYYDIYGNLTYTGYEALYGNGGNN
jgi:hypothetical protein